MLGTIHKAGRVLDLFDEARPEWGLSEIARQLHSPRSTVYELLASLVEIGMLSRTSQGRYRLGQRMVSFSTLYLKTTQVAHAAQDVLGELAEQFGESAHLVILDDYNTVLVENVYNSTTSQVHVGYGVRAPAYTTAAGKVLLSEMDWDKVKLGLEKRGLKPLTPNTITTIERLHGELEDIKRRGWAESVGEHWQLQAAVACAVRNDTGQAIAAIGASLPVQRYLDVRDELRNATMNAAAKVSAAMGFKANKP